MRGGTRETLCRNPRACQITARCRRSNREGWNPGDFYKGNMHVLTGGHGKGSNVGGVELARLCAKTKVFVKTATRCRNSKREGWNSRVRKKQSRCLSKRICIAGVSTLRGETREAFSRKSSACQNSSMCEGVQNGTHARLVIKIYVPGETTVPCKSSNLEE